MQTNVTYMKNTKQNNAVVRAMDYGRCCHFGLKNGLASIISVETTNPRSDISRRWLSSNCRRQDQFLANTVPSG